MSVYSVWGIPYETALQLIESLRAVDIQANITIGGIEIVPISYSQTEQMTVICGQYKAVPVEGRTPQQELIEERNERTRKRTLRYGEFRNPIDELQEVLESIKETKVHFTETLRELERNNTSHDTYFFNGSVNTPTFGALNESIERVQGKLETMTQQEQEYESALKFLSGKL